MKVLNLEQGSDEWLEFRRGKIGGTALGDIVVKRGTGEKQGFYQLIADRLTIKPADDEDPMDRGHRLEDEAIEAFEAQSGKKFNKAPGVWVSDFSDQIYISPDASSKDLKEACEVKHLASWKQVYATLEDKIPSEYDFQVLQYFIVNENLQTLYFIMRDDRLVEQFQLKVFTIHRKDLAEDIQKYTQYEIDKIKKIEEILGRIF
jgi:predicted phage-related endonuclease